MKTAVGKTGIDLLHDPALNKGTAFTLEERDRLGLAGLLPPRVSTPEQQARRFLGNLRSKATELEKYVEMMALLDRNETLFYRVVIDNLEEMLPIIYTPGVGTACQVYAHIYRRSRGLFITRREGGRVLDVLRNWPTRDVRVIVVTDGERILGLGDLGANGMGIPVGKLSLYTACAGVPPEWTLPVTLDVGTNNERLLNDPLYLGVPERRLPGPESDPFAQGFVDAPHAAFPGVLIQFEDFASHNAFRLLERYRDRACVFNDDIQGTAAVTLAALYSAERATGLKLSEQRLLFHGAGEAAIGIGNLAVDAMAAAGLPRAEARKRCWFMDSKGLVESGRRDLAEHKRAYAHEHAPLKTLAEAVRALKPTALIGVSGKAGEFTHEVVEAMTRLNPRPLVLALSNPTANAECTAEQAYAWSGGKAIFASGSPFGKVTLDGKTFDPGQANNAYIFPGVGLGAVASGATRVTDEMFLEAARALARLAGPKDLDAGRLFPPLTALRSVSLAIAEAVAKTAWRRGLASVPEPPDVPAALAELQYEPVYRSYA